MAVLSLGPRTRCHSPQKASRRPAPWLVAACLAALGPRPGTAQVPAAPLAVPAPIRLPAAPPGTAPALPAGTRLLVALTGRLTSGQARAGQAVPFAVAQDVQDGQVVLIPAGTPAAGTVAESRGAGAFGRAGTLRLTCDALTLPDGRHVALHLADAPGLAGRSSAGAAAATGGLLGLAAGGVTYVATDVSRNFFNDHPDRTGPALAGLGAGLAVGLLAGSLFRGGDVTLEPGRRFVAVLAQDLPGAAAPGANAGAPPAGPAQRER